MNFSTQFPTTLKNLFYTIIFLFLHFSNFAQTFQTAVGYGFPTDERGASGLITNAGDYLILAGNQQHPSGLFNPSGDMELLRLDNLGNLILPSRIIGQDVRESAVWIEKAIDCNGTAGYIIAGNKFDNGNNMLLTYTNAGGNPIWVREIGNPNLHETAACVKQDGAGNFILVGTKTDPNTGISVIQAVKTDCSGALLWERTYRINGSATTASVTAFATFQTACPGIPGAYFITGKTSGTGANEEVFILSVNVSNGNVGWMNTYDVAPGADDVATCIQGDCGGGAAGIPGRLWVSGYTLDGSASPKKVLMMETDVNGNLQWANQYDTQNSDLEWANHFQLAANNKLVLTGKAEDPGVSDPPENGQCLLMRIDDNGSGLDWTRVFTMGYASVGNRVEPTSADEYFITGHTFTIVQPHQFDYNVLAIKTDQLGRTNTNCYHSPDTKIIPRQPVVTAIQPTPMTPQDFFQTALQTVLIDDKQTFCPATQIDPCDTLGLTANFSISGVGNTLSFTDLSSPGAGTIFTWNWNFGDAGTSNLQNPTHTYASPGVYTVCLIITGGTAGMICHDTVCKDVLV
ncbi:MAG: PKD domain-containing protein, partial [Saprospiraceae bacterium]|nr:PKD domain-containing protein [Saprospiraceae bacterium]